MTDVFSPLCIRMTTDERTRMKTLLDEYDIDLKNVFSNNHKLSTKRNIIDMAKELSVYFARYVQIRQRKFFGFKLMTFIYRFSSSARLYPISSGSAKSGPDSQYLAVSHTGVKLVKRQKSLPTDYLEVGNNYFSTRIYDGS